MYYFLIRKILYSLLLLAVLGGLILVGRSIFFSWGNRTEPEKVLSPPVVQDTIPLSQTDETAAPSLENHAAHPSDPTRPPEAGKTETPVKTEETPPPPLPIKEKSVAERPPSKKAAPTTSKLSEESSRGNRPSKTKQKAESPPEGEKGAAPAPKEAALGPEGTHKVNKGDSIYAIAERAYGVSNTSVVDRILEANPRISDPDLLPARETIRLPKITEESLVIPSRDGLYQIRLGTFAKAEYADYLKNHPVLKDKEVEITPRTTASGKTWFRVTAGKFEDRDEALRTIRALKEQGLSPYFTGFRKKN